MKKILLSAIVGGLMFTSCKTRLIDFTIISTKNIDLSKAASFKRTNNRIEGESKAHIIVFIPTGVPNIKTAIDRAIESTKGAVALTDGVVYSKQLWALIYGQIGYVIEGNALIDPSLAANDPSEKPQDTYAKIQLNKKGEIVKKEAITPEEFNKTKAKYVKALSTK